MVMINGTNAADVLNGTSLNDIINGLSGDDTLNGAEDFDSLYGGDGNDLFLFQTSAGGPGILEDYVDGGAGDDTVDFSDVRFTPYSGGAFFISIEHIRGGQGRLQGSAEYDYLNLSNLRASTIRGARLTIDAGAGNDEITGGVEDDEIFGGDGNDILIGSDGNDILNGGAGNDQFYLAGDPDTIIGGSGVDTVRADFTYSLSGVVIDMTAGVGRGTINGGAVSGIEGYDVLFGSRFDDIIATGNIRTDTTIFGGAYLLEGNDTATGGSLTDRFSGGAGNDVLNGGAGNDILQGDQGDDHLIGGYGDDDLNGGDEGDQLSGGAGNDVLNGALGDDLLIGGAGDDVLSGGDGIDTVSYSDLNIGVIVDLTRTTVQNAAGGIDRLSGFENVIGTAFNDVLTGDAGANILTGGGGSDQLIGGSGDDRLDGGVGIDAVDFAAAAAAVVANLQVGSASGGAGNDILIDIENLIGTKFNDVLTGNGGANGLKGGAGDDSLIGGGGEDLLDGGAGIDLASYADAASAVTVSLRLATRQNTLGAGVDTLVDIETLEGSGFNDTLSGNAGANVLIGGAGVDTANYAGAAAGVRVNLAIAGRQNTVGDGVDTLTAIENLNGSAFADQLTGDAGNNRLIGNAGFDILVGGLGDDFLSGGADHDVASYAGLGTGVTVNLGITTAQDTLGGGIDTLVGIEGLVGTNHADRLTGNAFGNGINGGGGDDVIDAGGGSGPDFLSGGTGNDVIKGGGGADNLLGDAGADILTGGAGNDNFEYNLASESRIGSGVDRITDFAMGDILDISEVDANALTTGIDENEAFVLVTSFTQTAGELTLAFDAGSNTTTLLGDTNGDGVGDFSILFTGNVASAITANWVLLSD